MSSENNHPSENKDIVDFLAPLREPVATPQSEERLNALLALAKELGPKVTLLGMLLAFIHRIFKGDLPWKNLIIALTVVATILGIATFALTLTDTISPRQFDPLPTLVATVSLPIVEPTETPTDTRAAAIELPPTFTPAPVSDTPTPVPINTLRPTLTPSVTPTFPPQTPTLRDHVNMTYGLP